MSPYSIYLNRLAQGVIPIKEGLLWFSTLNEQERDKVMHNLNLCIHQSHPTKADIELGIENSDLKDTYSPCVLIRKKHFNLVRQKVLNFTDLDQERAFELFVHVFSVADTRRRTEICKGKCTHEWHNLESI